MFRTNPTSITEKQIESSILEWLSFKKIFAWKVNTVGIYDQQQGCYRKPNSKYIIKGISDILGILKIRTKEGITTSKFLAIEVKVPARRNNITEHQQHFIDTINSNGGIAFVATSLEEVKAEIKKWEGDSRPLTADPPNILYPHP